jgi:hypothetical protein
MAPTPQAIVYDVVRNLLNPYPPATLSLGRPLVRLPRPAVSHAHWRGLPEFALSALFRHLPVPDLLRLGYLFTPRWREVWRMEPLHLHDRQFTSLPIPRSEVADAIANVLEEYLDDPEDEAVVRSFRVESTEWRPDHAARWCAALERGEAVDVVLFNRGVAGQPPVLISVPPQLLNCTTVMGLHLAFFTVEAGELDALTGTMDLGLHGCACRPGVVEGVVAACTYLERLSIQDSVLGHSVVVRSAHRLSRLSMLRSVSRSLTVDDAPRLRELLPGSTAALSISGAPNLTSLMRLNLRGTTTLEIDGAEITVCYSTTLSLAGCNFSTDANSDCSMFGCAGS